MNLTVRNMLLTVVLLALALVLLGRGRCGVRARLSVRTEVYCTGGSRPIEIDGRTVGCTR